ncbi:MAG TPA: PQQ-binding-like beta-propeller repeat protein [Byssovorax sp.]|jgi:outer membrane protein assembly factor BamB
MDYRDERGALRERVEGLEQDLADARTKLDAHAREDTVRQRAAEIGDEIAATRARLDALEAELRALSGAGGAKPKPRRRVLPIVLVTGVVVAGAACALITSRRVAGPPVSETPVEASLAERTPVNRAPAEIAPPRPVRDSIFAHRGICFVGGDGAKNLIVLARTHGGLDAFRVAAIDGKTGKVAWETRDPIDDDAGNQTLRLCPNPETVLVATRDRWVRAYDAKTGAVRWEARVGDAPRTAAFGATGCVAITLADQTIDARDLATGKPAPCQVEPPKAERSLHDDDAPEVSVTAGDETITLRQKPAGTPMLKIVGTGARAWERDLGLKALVGTSKRLRLAVVGDVALLLGEDELRAGDLSLVGVSTRDGRVLYTNHLGVTNNSWIPDYVAEDGLLYLSFGGGLRAYDPSTGAERWRAHT